MSKSIRSSSKYLFKRLKCIFGLIFLLGFSIFLFYFCIFIFPHSFLFDRTTLNSTLPTLCIVARVYSASIPYFPVLALALYHTGLDNIRIYVINTDNQPDLRQLEQTIRFLNDIAFREDFVTFLDLGQPPRENDFGYGMTDRALAYLYRQHMNSPSICQYVTFTNGDNFYSRNFAKKILPHMKTKKDIIGWSFTSHHYKPHYRELINRTNKTVPKIVDDATEKCTPVELKSGFADLGAVAYRLSFLRKHNLYFQQPGVKNSYGTDGDFVDQASRRTNASIILRQTLLVHQ